MPETLTSEQALEATWDIIRARHRINPDYRFVPEEVTPTLVLGASNWASTYSGTFSFMVDMRLAARRGRLSVNQAKGVLNCMLADVRRQAQQAATPTETVDMSALMTLFQRAGTRLRNPRITLQLNGRPLTLKLMTRGQHPGSINIQSGSWPNGIWYGRVNPDGSLMQTRFMREDALELVRELGADPVAAAQRYAGLTGNCCFCNLPLTTDESVSAGYGPVCAEHYGLPWGNRPNGRPTRRRRSNPPLTGVNADYYSAEQTVARSQRFATPQVEALEGMTPLGLQAEALINEAEAVAADIVREAQPEPARVGPGVSVISASDFGWAAGIWPAEFQDGLTHWTRGEADMGGEDEAELLGYNYWTGRPFSRRNLYVEND